MIIRLITFSQVTVCRAYCTRRLQGTKTGQRCCCARTRKQAVHVLLQPSAALCCSGGHHTGDTESTLSYYLSPSFLPYLLSSHLYLTHSLAVCLFYSFSLPHSISTSFSLSLPLPSLYLSHLGCLESSS